jgi:hypothetical protein
VTEAEARALLRAWQGAGGLEAWIAEQPWQVVPGKGWSVTRDLLRGCDGLGGLALPAGGRGARSCHNAGCAAAQEAPAASRRQGGGLK